MPIDVSWWVVAAFALIAATLVLWYLHPLEEWILIIRAWQCGAHYQCPRRDYRLIPRRLKNWWGRRKGFSGCGRCGDSWWWKPKHVTQYIAAPAGVENAGSVIGQGCFPLCEECWVWLGTPKDRLPYYAALIAWWAEYEPVPLDTQRQIFSAVAEGK